MADGFTSFSRFEIVSKVNYPIVLGTKETKELFTSAETLPLMVVIDREGNVRELIEGILLPEEFDEKVKPLLIMKPQRGLPTKNSLMREAA